MKKAFLLLLTLTALINVGYSAPTCDSNKNYCKWVAYYSDKATTPDFSDYNPIVFDSVVHPKIAPLTSEGRRVFGHLSLGEINSSSSYFQIVQKKGLLLSQNPYSPGSWYVDIRHPFWKNLMINEVIPKILSKGFNGIFMDTLDIPLYLEQTNPAGYTGMGKAAGDLVIAIRKAFPKAYLMMNRAYQLLPSVGGYINYALGESLYTTYNFATKVYEYVPRDVYEQQLNALQKAQGLYPSLVVLTLDYWWPTDPDTIKKIYSRERKNGFRPYVAGNLLNVIYPEPQ